MEAAQGAVPTTPPHRLLHLRLLELLFFGLLAAYVYSLRLDPVIASRLSAISSLPKKWAADRRLQAALARDPQPGARLPLPTGPSLSLVSWSPGRPVTGSRGHWVAVVFVGTCQR